MNNGRLDGKQVIPAEVMQSVHTGYADTVRDSPPFTGSGNYGLGWQIGKYRDENVVYHHGGYPGWSSHIACMPDKKIGVAVMINESTARRAYRTSVGDICVRQVARNRPRTKRRKEFIHEAHERRITEGKPDRSTDKGFTPTEPRK